MAGLQEREVESQREREELHAREKHLQDTTLCNNEEHKVSCLYWSYAHDI